MLVHVDEGNASPSIHMHSKLVKRCVYEDDASYEFTGPDSINHFCFHAFRWVCHPAIQKQTPIYLLVRRRESPGCGVS